VVIYPLSAFTAIPGLDFPICPSYFAIHPKG
jgi:hypothetical protein